MYIGGDGVAHCAARTDEPDPPVVELPQLVGCTLVVHTHHPVIQAAHNLVVVHLNLQNNTHIRVSTHLNYYGWFVPSNHVLVSIRRLL